MSTYVVTGTSRGLGLGLVEELALMPATTVRLVFAATRSQKPSNELRTIMEASNGRVKHVQLVVDSTDSIKTAALQVSTLLDGEGLDYLINNAAVREPTWSNIEEMDFIREALDTNVTGTHEAICAFLPLLRKGKGKKIVNFSSTLGAITTAQTDPSLMRVEYPAYKISKAGTHMLTAPWSNRLKDEDFCVYIQSPGNLKTQLAGGERADLPVKVGAKEVIRIAHSSEPKDTGRHRNIYVKGWEQGGGVGGRYDGQDLPCNGPPGPDVNVTRSHVGSVPYGVAIHACTNPGQVALTFDDGPTEYTRGIAKMLSRNNFTATFFMVGYYDYHKIYDNTTRYPELIRSLHAAGHQIGSHTWTHFHLNDLTKEQRRRQVLDNEKALARLLGFTPTYLRPPFGQCSNECLAELKELGYHVVLWDIDTKDYMYNTDRGYYTTRDRFWADFNAGGTLALFHDTKIYTADKVIPWVIKFLKSRGIRGVSVGECMGDDRANWYRKVHNGYIQP